jgi:serine/threonine protein kinase
MPITVAARICADLAAGLSALHAARDPFSSLNRLLHGALRPTNVQLNYFGQAALSDLALADPLIDPAQLKEEHAHYLAPELFAGSAQDVSSEVYALGAMLYVMLTMRYPSQGRTLHAIVSEKCTRSALPVATLCPQVPEELSVLVDRTLSIEPDRRQPDMRCVQHDLESFLDEYAEGAAELNVANWLHGLLGPRVGEKRDALEAIISQSLQTGGSLLGEQTIASTDDDLFDEEPQSTLINEIQQWALAGLATSPITRLDHPLPNDGDTPEFEFAKVTLAPARSKEAADEGR